MQGGWCAGARPARLQQGKDYRAFAGERKLDPHAYGQDAAEAGEGANRGSDHATGTCPAESKGKKRAPAAHRLLCAEDWRNVRNGHDPSPEITLGQLFVQRKSKLQLLADAYA